MDGANLPQARTKLGITAFLNKEDVKEQLRQAVGKHEVCVVCCVGGHG